MKISKYFISLLYHKRIIHLIFNGSKLTPKKYLPLNAAIVTVQGVPKKFLRTRYVFIHRGEIFEHPVDPGLFGILKRLRLWGNLSFMSAKLQYYFSFFLTFILFNVFFFTRENVIFLFFILFLFSLLLLFIFIFIFFIIIIFIYFIFFILFLYSLFYFYILYYILYCILILI